MRTRAFAGGVCSGRVVSLMIAHLLEYPKSAELLYFCKLPDCFSLVSCATRVLSESIFISCMYVCMYGHHI